MMYLFFKTFITEIKTIFLYQKVSLIMNVVMQIFWAWLNIMIFCRFVDASFSAEFQINDLCTYVWLMQSFIGITALWIRDDKVISAIKYGEIAYDLLRPISLFSIWTLRVLTRRLSIVLVQGIPVLIYAYFCVPGHFALQNSVSPYNSLLFLISLVLALCITATIMNFVNIISALTLSSDGITYILGIIGGLFVGSLIPLPLLPEWFQKINLLSPFGGIADIPFKIYLGFWNISKICLCICIQIGWVVIFNLINWRLFKKLGEKITIQGG